jgi:predicted transcriptional regulator
MSDLQGDQLLTQLGALANPHRLRIVAAIADEPKYVSALARELGISRPLMQVHLRRLEAAGLITSELRLSEQGTAMKYYTASPFELSLTPATIAPAVRTLTDRGEAGDAE